MIALIGQLLLGGMARDATLGNLGWTGFAAGAAVPICHGGAQPGDETPALPGHHGTDCALCPLCLALAAHAVLPAPPAPPLPRVILARHAPFLPPARAPPAPAVLAATYPTGPPILA